MLFEALTKPRITVVTAHPDDETVGAGWLLTQIRNPVLITVTDGSPRNPADARAAGCASREEYAGTRRFELFTAMRAGGVDLRWSDWDQPGNAFALGVTDQDASFAMPAIAHRLSELFATLKPPAILTCAYEGGHPDHDAVAFCVQAACDMMDHAPPVFEFPLYHAATASEPGRAQIETARFLSGQDQGSAEELSPDARETKERMIESFATQLHMLRHFPLDVERFRMAPLYDFSVAPHPGRLYYEYFEWGMTGTLWRMLAAQAKQELGANATI